MAQSVKLNLIPGSVLPVVNVSQYDKGRTFVLHVYDGPTEYSLTGMTVEIRGTKPDKKGFAYGAEDGVVSVSGSSVTITTTLQMTACAGPVTAELMITQGSSYIGTLNFIILCEPAALADDTDVSRTEIPIIERDLEDIVDEVTGYIEDAEAWAIGTRGGSPVPVADPAYDNNSKYYAEMASSVALYPPYIGENGNWWVYSTDLLEYIDSGIDASVSVSVGETTTLPAGSQATVTATGTMTDMVLNFGIPRGEKGANGSGSMVCDEPTETIIFTPGGSGGTNDYVDLDNKPQINSITLQGNKTSAELDLTSLVGTYSNESLTLS